MSITYKQFQIDPNLRCYRLFDMDKYGKVGMFPSTEFKSVDEIKARIDKYWKEAEEYEARRTVDLRKSFEILMADTDESDEAREMEAEAFEDKVNDYWERETWEGGV